MLEEVVERQNMRAAYQQVKRNVGADLAFAPATGALSIVSVSIGSGVVSSGIVTLLSPAPVEEEDASG